MMEEHELGGKLLSGVSRSFYLTLKALPEGLREPLSLAYLLARAADTLADTTGVADAVKMDGLREFGRLVQLENRDVDGEKNLCQKLKQDFLPLQEDADEARLLERLEEALEAFAKFPARQKEAMRGVLKPIVSGQMLDIERFPADGELRALKTAAELDDYTWLVAGCVGEFWTKLCDSELPDVFAPNVTLEQMKQWGGRYGKGLQLVNILRDTAKDGRLGRCYLPEEEMAAAGFDVSQVKENPDLLTLLLPKWRNLCREHLLCGLEYVESLEHKRLKYATALPLLLGVKTLALIEKASPEALQNGVKVSRGDVAKVMFDAGIASLRRGGIRKMVEKMLQ